MPGKRLFEPKFLSPDQFPTRAAAGDVSPMHAVRVKVDDRDHDIAPSADTFA